MSGYVEVVEVGPRDGLQNEHKTLTTDTRIELIRKLVVSGVRRMEAVSFVHPKRVPQMAGAEEVMANVPNDGNVSYIGLVLNRKGVERAAQTNVHEVNIAVPVTNEFSLRNQGKSVHDMILEARRTADLARQAGLRVSVTLAVAFGCPFQGEVSASEVQEVLAAVDDMDIDEIALADTIGVGVPRQVKELAQYIVPRLNGRKLRFHFHNTRNTGYANAIAAADITGAGTIALDAAVGGFGGCPFAPRATGNIGTEDLLYALQKSNQAEPDLNLDRLCATAEWLGEQLVSPVQSLLPKAGNFPSL